MKKSIPFEFVLEELASLAPRTNPMFGCTAVYVESNGTEKIVFILRQKGNPIEDDGVWLATTGEHHKSLQKDFPNMRSIKVFGPGPTGWQVLPVDASDFEESVIRACEFVKDRDPRIGKIPKTKLRKGAKSKKTTKKKVANAKRKISK